MYIWNDHEGITAGGMYDDALRLCLQMAQIMFEMTSGEAVCGAGPQSCM